MKSYIITLLVVLFVSCTSDNLDKEYNYLAQSLKESNVKLDNYKYIVILPGTGCHGCIQEGEFFLKQNVDNKSILFILNNPSSLKILQHKLRININDYDNIIVDKSSRFCVPTKKSIYPCVIFIEENEIQNLMFQMPQSKAFYELQRDMAL